jgi:CubicO group peptidase (beta-lactamase class C family)
MKTMVVALAAMMIAVPCCAQEKSIPVDERIRNVENGLVELGAISITEIFRAGGADAQAKKTLAERMRHYNVPGLCITVIDDYRIDWAKAYGVTVAGTEKPVTTDTLFEAASTTKLIAAVAALRLVEQGLLDPDKDVNAYLKSWTVPENEFTQEHKVTLRLLLTHRSGLNRPDGGFGYEEGSTPTLVQVLKGEAPAENQPALVEFTPGSKHQYSNFGFIVVQLLLEDTTGKPFSQTAREMVFDPLGMKNSVLDHPLTPELKARAILPHDPSGKSYDRGRHPTALAQGGLLTTPTDLALFAVEIMRAYQGRPGTLISQATAREMLSPALQLDPGQFFGYSAQGLGVFLIGAGDSLYFSYPGHNDPGANCMLIGAPASGKGAVVMTNGAAGLLLSLEILAALVNEYNWPIAQEQ